MSTITKNILSSAIKKNTNPKTNKKPNQRKINHLIINQW